MEFSERLRRKITVNQLANQVIRSWGPPDNPRRMDQEAMKALLTMSDLTHERQREMDVYYRAQADDKGLILILDNELKVYHTDMADAVMRKNPTLKEMVSIRNAIKILNDKAITFSRKADTVRWLQDDIISGLDLSYTAQDIARLAQDGRNALSNSYGEGVVDTLTLFAELLNFIEAPKAFAVTHCRIWGVLSQSAGGHPLLGPMVIFNQIDNHLALEQRPANASDPEAIQRISDVAKGKIEANVKGEAVWTALAEKVLA